MKLNTITWEALQAAGIDTGKLVIAYETACKQGEVVRSRTTQQTRTFRVSESSRLTRADLTPEQDLALQLCAFDAYMVKAQTLWGLAEWGLPRGLLEAARRAWPFQKK